MAGKKDTCYHIKIATQDVRYSPISKQDSRLGTLETGLSLRQGLSVCAPMTWNPLPATYLWSIKHINQVIHTTNNSRRQYVEIISFPSNDCIKYEFKEPARTRGW